MIELENVQGDNSMYAGKLLLGSSLSEANVIMDTGSEYLVVTSTLCKTDGSSCPTRVYDPSRGAQELVSKDGKPTKITYGNA